MKASIGFVMAFCCSALAAAGGIIFLAAKEPQAQPAQLVQHVQNRNVGLVEVYDVSTIIELSYGESDGRVGLLFGRQDVQAVGPLSFAVTAGQIYVLDTVNERVSVFDRNGQFQRSIPMGYGTDLVVKRDGTIYMLNSGESVVIEYQPHSGSQIRHPIPYNFLADLKLDREENVSVRVSDEEIYSIAQSVSKVGTRVSGESYSCRILDNYTGAITDNQTGKEIQVSTTQVFGSITCLGTDRHGNIFVIVEKLLPADVISVEKEVQKYTSTGELVATIPVAIDYVAHPIRELIIDDDGNVYHLRPLQDRLLIQQWHHR